MNASFQPIQHLPWSEFPAECLWYLVPMCIFHLAVFIVGCLILIASSQRSQRSTLKCRVARFGLFVALFLFVGSLFNGLWSCLIYVRFYHSSDYVFGFIPFLPLTRGWLEMRDDSGQLISNIPLHLHLFWLLFTAGTWGVTVLSYRLLLRKRPLNAAMDPTALGNVGSAAQL
jgi:hypothetical protein